MTRRDRVRIAIAQADYHSWLRWPISLLAVSIVLNAATGPGTPVSIALLDAIGYGPVKDGVAIVWAVALLGATWCWEDHWRTAAGAVAVTLCVMNGIAGPVLGQSWATVFTIPGWMLVASAVFEVASYPQEQGRSRRCDRGGCDS